MAAPIFAEPRQQPIQIEHFSEDKLWKKALCCVPFVGYIAATAFEKELGVRIMNADLENPRQIIDLITLKNQYKKCSIASYILTIALCVTAVALHILPLVYAIGNAVVFSILTGLTINQIYKNNLSLNEIEDQGPRRNMPIY